ncbi:MAG: hypothetical protein M3Z25_14770 [Actinomycetota bacterium]|nr:hypothetical protein [Actinomycetota bacterium]
MAERPNLRYYEHMFERPIGDVREAVEAALVELRAESGGITGQDLVDQLTFLHSLIRQVRHDSLRTIARLSSEGEFEKRGVRPAPAVADLLRVAPREARRLVATATAGVPHQPRR